MDDDRNRTSTLRTCALHSGRRRARSRAQNPSSGMKRNCVLAGACCSFCSSFFSFTVAETFLTTLAHLPQLGRTGITASAMLVQECIGVLATFAAAAIMSMIEDRPFSAYGLPLGGAFRARFWQGAAWGIAMITAMMLLIRAFGGYSFGEVALHGSTLWGYAILWIVVFVFVGLFEEFLFRGYAQYHARYRHRILAHGHGSFRPFRRRSPSQRRRRQRRSAQRVCDRHVFLPDAVAHREFVVRGRVACGVRLGRNIFVFRAGQRHCRARPLAEFLLSRSGMAHRRHGGSRGERHGIRGRGNLRCNFCAGLSVAPCDGSSGIRKTDATERLNSAVARASACGFWSVLRTNPRRLKPAPHKSAFSVGICLQR